MTETPSAEIQGILANLQEEIRRHRLALGELGAVERPDPLAGVRQRAWVNPHLPIGWPVMPKGIIPKIVAYTQKVVRRMLRWYINPLVEQQNAYNSAVNDLLAKFCAQSEANAQLVQQLQTQLGQSREAYAQLQRQWQESNVAQTLLSLAAQVQQVAGGQQALGERMDEQRETAQLRLQRLENWRRDSVTPNAPQWPAGADASTPRFDHFLLGAQHRNEKQLRERLSDYDDLFTALLQSQRRGEGPRGGVLDIGCGRGEFVEHLAGLGLAAYGIDLDADVVEMGRDAGRDVRLEDATAHLQGLPDNSLAAITMIQVIEHFPLEDALSLLRLAALKLAPGGLLVAETVNPLCLIALTNAYLLDPSHSTALHPLTAAFLMQQAGLWRVTTRFLRPVAEQGRLERLPDADCASREWASAQNRNVAKLNQLLYGPQDYATVAYKPEA